MIKNIVCFFVVISTNTFAQLHHQTIGAGGGSSNNGVVFSVGQASVVGNHFAQGYSINQGFVQPIEGSYHFKPNGDSLHVTVYPNPFVESFSAERYRWIGNNVYWVDLDGRVVRSVQSFHPFEKDIEMTFYYK